MSIAYTISITTAAKFALLPGKAERLFLNSFVPGAQNWRTITTGILVSRYSMFAGVIFSAISAAKAASLYPTMIAASVTAGASVQLYRYTKLFMDTVDGNTTKNTI